MVKQKENPLCTVVVLTYNGEKYVKEMLSSVKRQTYRPLQLIISDDASTDLTAAIVKSWAAENNCDDFEAVFVGHSVNRGRAGNRNSIINRIKGEVVFLADQDDVWHRDKVAKQAAFLDEHPECAGVSCDRRLIDPQGKILLRSEDRYCSRRHEEILDIYQNASFGSNYPANCIALSTVSLKKVFSVPNKMEEPDRFLRMMILCTGKLGFINEPLVDYRIHENNLSGNYFVQYHRNIVAIFKFYVHINRRYNRIFAEDDKIIVLEAFRRFHIDLNDGPRYLKRKKRRVIWEAFCSVVRDIQGHRIGEFL